MEFKYNAILTKQAESGKPLILFAAPADEIFLWGGIPQKKLFEEGEESGGFQRVENPTRLKDIGNFLSDDSNIIQNPLLCASRKLSTADVTFWPTSLGEERESDLGVVSITMPDFNAMKYIEILTLVKEHLESRLGFKKVPNIDDEILNRMQLRARTEGWICDEETNDEEEIEEDSLEVEEGDEKEDDSEEQHISEDTEYTREELEASSVLFEKSHIEDFWREIEARRQILLKLPDFNENSFLGFDKEALISYLTPVVIVDGQHRLKGALATAQKYEGSEEGIAETKKMLLEGKTSKQIRKILAQRVIRHLPISLILDDNPAEHVFQFVVVNQKATQIPKALLGTIVSTSLTNEELDGVAARLTRAGIPLEESRAASFLAVDESSPFKGLVDRGMGKDTSLILSWPVFTALVNVFKSLKGATPYHGGSDYADSWRKHCLNNSGIVHDFKNKKFDNPYDYWSAFDGPWRYVFIIFWTYIRDHFGNTTEPESRNFWGRPKTSNLFNKVSLNILAADFFKYLRTNNLTIESQECIQDIIERWLTGVNYTYFDRPYDLEKTGQKKDSRGIRIAWSKLWDEYRSCPDQLPSIKRYRQSAGN